MRFSFYLLITSSTALLVCLLSFAALAQDTLTLRTAVRQARLNNPFLRAYQYQVPALAGDVTSAGLRPNFLFNNQTLQLASQRYAGSFRPNSDLFSNYNRQTWFQLTKVYQLAGQRQRAITYSRKQYQFAQRDVAEYTRGVLNQAALQWLNAWYAAVILDITAQARYNADSVYAINRLRLKNQVVTQTDFLRTQVLSEQYLTQYLAAQQALRSESQKLKFLLGMAPADSVLVDLDETPYLNAGNYLSKNAADSLVEVSLRARTDLLAARSQQEAAEANVAWQKSRAYPTPEAGIIYNPQNGIPYAGWYITVPLPTFNRNQGEIQKSKVLLQQTGSTIDALERQVKAEVRTSQQEVVVARDVWLRYRRIIDESDQVLQAVKYSYVRGGTSILDYLEAQRSWFDTRRNYFDALLAYRQKYVNLLYVTGLINEF